MHRIGRTGRAGAVGEAISLVCVDEDEFMRNIERLLKRKFTRDAIPGFEPDPSIRAEPIFKARAPRGHTSPRPGADRRPGGHRRGGQGQSARRKPQGRA